MRTKLLLAAVVVLAGCTGMRERQRLAERELLKKEILQELRAELASQPGTTPPAAPPASPSAAAEKDPPGAGLADRSAGLPAATVELPAASPAPHASCSGPALQPGLVEGQLLRGGKGSASARVRIVRMEVFRSKHSADYRANDYYDTRTDADGRYRFASVEPGHYKLLWTPPGAGYWVRHLADRPDVTVKESQTAVVPAIETKRKLLAK